MAFQKTGPAPTEGVLTLREELVEVLQERRVVAFGILNTRMVMIAHSRCENDADPVLLGSDGSQSIGVEEMAAWAGTIAHEILTSINTRVPRVYVQRSRAEAEAKGQ